MHEFLNFILGMNLYMFRTVPLSIIRSFSLYTQHWYMSYWNFKNGKNYPFVKFQYDIYQCCMWKTPDDGQRNCLKHVEFHSKQTFEKLVHLFGFIITRCMVTWISLFIISAYFSLLQFVFSTYYLWYSLCRQERNSWLWKQTLEKSALSTKL
jgi:hypothetical protein